MKQFEQPEMIITLFAVKDVLTTSIAVTPVEDVQGQPIDEMIERVDR